MATKWITFIVLMGLFSQTCSNSRDPIYHPAFKYFTYKSPPSTTTNAFDPKAPGPDITIPPKDKLLLFQLVQRKPIGMGDKRISTTTTTTTTTTTLKPDINNEKRDNPKPDTTANVPKIDSKNEHFDDGKKTSPDLPKPQTTMAPNIPEEDSRKVPFSWFEWWLAQLLQRKSVDFSMKDGSTTTMRPPNFPLFLQSRYNQFQSGDNKSDKDTTVQGQGGNVNTGVDTTELTTVENVDNNKRRSEEIQAGEAKSRDEAPTAETTQNVNNIKNPADNPVSKGGGENKDTGVQDKPFHGASLSNYFDDHTTDSGKENNSFNTDQLSYEANFRLRRAASSVADIVKPALCSNTSGFEQCQYYPTCFHEINSKCQSRVSFIGDDANRFCERTKDRSLPEKLRNYLMKVENCTREELSTFLQSPSCDDITICLTKALLVKTTSSCLFQDGELCLIVEDPIARPALAKFITSPTTDFVYVSRLMMNFGELVSFCKNKGSSLFVTDITLLATSKNSPFKNEYSQTPIPGVVNRTNEQQTVF